MMPLLLGAVPPARINSLVAGEEVPVVIYIIARGVIPLLFILHIACSRTYNWISFFLLDLRIAYYL